MFLSRLLKISVNHMQFQNGKLLSDFIQFKQVRQKLIYPMNKGQIRVLMDILGIRYRIAYGISREHTNLRTTDQVLLYKSAAMLTRFGFTKDDLLEYPQMLCILPMTIENHAMLLEEAGFTSIRPKHLLRFIVMIRKPVRLLKAYNYIPQDVEVHNNFFNDLEDPPPPLELPNSDDSDFVDVYLAAITHYLCWKLELSKHELERLLNIYPRLKYRSFRLMESSMNILENELGFTKDRIRRHGYLIHTTPQNTLDTLERIKYIGGMDIRTLFRRCPKTVVMATDTLLKTDQYLQDFGIPNEAIWRCPEVYTLASETVNERLHALQSVPQFAGLITNPRVVNLVHYQRKAYARLSYLDKFKFKCVSLHILQASQATFERFLTDGCNRTFGNDVVIYLSNELDCDKVEMRKLLHRHPFWINVPLVTVVETLDFIRKRGFTKEQILFNIQILLYPSKQVQKQLEQVPFHPDLYNELLRQKELHNGNEIEFSQEQQLALSLYLIERDHHFSGDGIWFENPNVATSDKTTA